MLKRHLSTIQRAGLIALQADIDVSPGEEWEQKIRHYLNTAQMILLLVSADFLSSDYCYAKEMMRALEQHNAGKARVIAIILRPTSWHRAPFGKLQVLPTNAEPISSKYWHTIDDAFFDVTKGIEKAAEELLSGSPGKFSTVQQTRVPLQEPQKSRPFAQNTAEQLPGQKASTSQPTGIIVYTYRYQADGALGTGAATAVVWSPDGKHIASIAQKMDTTVQVWNALDGSYVLTSPGHAGRFSDPSNQFVGKFVRTVAWSPDGKYMASGGNDQTVQVWDAITGRCLSIHAGFAGGWVAWSPDGKYIVSSASLNQYEWTTDTSAECL